MRMLIKNGRVIDPASNTDDIRDILVEDGVIAEVAKDIDKAADTVIDAKGCMVMPGLVDLHVHFREPGFEHKETIRTGARAAARGGFTTVCPMPNTKPAIDSVEMVEYIKNKSEEVTDINILPIAAMTAGQDGEYITDYERLYEEGAVAVSEDGKSVMNARVARQAMRLAAEVGIPVFAHCEDKDLAARGVMNAGNKARELGFDIVPYIRVYKENQNLEELINLLKEKAAYLSYPIDGLVAAYNDIAYGLSLGVTDKYPRHSLAYKFYNEEYITTLINIEWQVGKTGIISPIAVFEPIEIEGSIITKASLFNLSILKEKLGHPYVGQKLWIIKANQVIPYITKAERMREYIWKLTLVLSQSSYWSLPFWPSWHPVM